MTSIFSRTVRLGLAGMVAGSIGFGGSAFMASQSTAGAQVAASSPTSRPGEKEHERHPEIRRALAGLREAKRALEKADHDFDGHRVAALKDVDAGIKELEEALKVDKK